jgi:sugar phosphate isomerase/epimerase
MKIGLYTDTLPDLPLDELLPAVADMGIEGLEFGTGNWSRVPHLNMDELLDSETQCREFLAKLKAHGLSICALNCSGNQLLPGEGGEQQRDVVRKTLRLARQLEVDRIVMMSGLPPAPGDSHPNWVTTAFEPGQREILDHQWNKVAIPYWHELVSQAKNEGVSRICLELHGVQLVYNPATLLRLREAVGDTVGANLDPSHLMWMGADPLRVATALGDAIYYVHAKDTRVDPDIAGTNTPLESRWGINLADRAWNYVTLGYEHGEVWWHDFISRLRSVGYDDIMSIEHEGYVMSEYQGFETSNQEAIRQSVDLLKRARSGKLGSE